MTTMTRQEATGLRTHSIRGGGGLLLHVREWGPTDAPPVVLIHGLSQNHQCWVRQYGGSLADDFRLIAFDLRGHGMSEAPADAASYADGRLWADDLAAVIDQLGLDHPVLVGWSYGAFVIVDYLRAYGQDNVAALDFVGGAVRLGPPAFGSLIGPGFLDNFADVTADDLPTNIRGVRGLVHAFAADPIPADDIETILCASMAVSAATRGHLGARDLDSDDVLRDLRVPLLVSHGRADTIVLPAMAEHVLDVCPTAESSWYDGVGHVPFLERPERFNAELAALARRPRGSAAGGTTASTQLEMPPEHAEFAPLEAWDAIAVGYADHVAPGEQSLSAAALSLVELAPGETFLDVAAGPGGLGLAAARMGAAVLATDWAPKMVAQFESRARSEGLTAASARVMDAHALDLADDRFDVTGSQFGVMLVPDQASALREMVRVTKHGGRVLLVAYGSPDDFGALQLFVAALQTVVSDFDGLPDPPPLEFQVSDPEVMHERLVAAGLSDVEVDSSHQERLELSSGQEAWDWMVFSNPITAMLLDDIGVDEVGRATMRSELDRMIHDRVDAAGVAVITAPINIGWGRKDDR